MVRELNQTWHDCAARPRLRPIIWGLALAPQECAHVVVEAGHQIAALGAPNWSALARQLGRDRRTIKKVVLRAQGPAPTLHRAPTGGAANSRPRLGLFELLYLQARAPPAPRAHRRFLF